MNKKIDKHQITIGKELYYIQDSDIQHAKTVELGHEGIVKIKTRETGKESWVLCNFINQSEVPYNDKLPSSYKFTSISKLKKAFARAFKREIKGLTERMDKIEKL